MYPGSEQLAQVLEQAVAQAWVDDDFKAELIAHPHQALADLGLELPERLAVEFVDEPTAKLGDWTMSGNGLHGTLRVAIPAPPEGAMTEDQLATVGGGKSACCCSSITIMCCGP